MVKFGTVWIPNWPKCDILHICIMRKLVENCVHSFVKNPMNFMNLKGLFLQSVTLLAAPRGDEGKWGTGRGPNGGDLEERRRKGKLQRFYFF